VIEHTTHDDSCAHCWCRPCRAFSTDGTRLGQAIAHTMGTTDENAITRRGRDEQLAHLTGMTDEQAEWESTDGVAWT
jgi:hypothetical protein